MGGFCDGSGEGIGRGGPFNFFVTRILHFEIHVFVFFSCTCFNRESHQTLTIIINLNRIVALLKIHDAYNGTIFFLSLNNDW